MIFDRLANGIVKHAKLIVIFWLVVLILAAPFAMKAGSVMSYDTTEMADENSESIQGFEVLSKYFPESEMDVSNSPIIVIQLDNKGQTEMAMGLVDKLNAEVPHYIITEGEQDTNVGDPKLVGFQGLPEPIMGEDGTGIMMVMAEYQDYVTSDLVAADTVALRDFIHDVEDAYAEEVGDSYALEVYLTGNNAIMQDMMDGAMKDISRIDPFTILLILLLVGLFFRSIVTSATPPMTIGFAFIVVLALIFGLGHVFNIFFITEMMLMVSMMGAGCDYCIFIIARYREERRQGLSHEDALHQAIVWAGESIATSGASVIIGFGAMSLCSFSMISTMGICLALGIIVALIAALTLIPAVLALVGDRIFWPTRMKDFEEGGKATKGWYAWCGRLGQRYFNRSAKFSLKHAKVIVLAAVLITVPAAYMTITNETSYDMVSSMQTGESGEGMDLIGDYASSGMLMPNYAVIEFKEPVANIEIDPTFQMPKLEWTQSWEDMDKSMTSMYDDIATDPNIASVVGPFEWNFYVAESGETDLGKILLYMNEELSPSAMLVVYKVTEGMTENLIKGLVAQGMPLEQATATASAMVVSTGGPVIDYMVNKSEGVIGGEFAHSQTGTGAVTYVKISVSTVEAAMAPVSMDSIGHMTDCVDRFMAEHPDEVADKWVTGSAVVMFEVSESISTDFAIIEVLVVVLIMLLLFVVMRSYAIPLRSVLTILMSITWTLALTHILFVNVLGGEVMWLIPLILLVICLGLGMDYDILLTTRIKENVRARGMSNDDAIYHAVTHTGSVITICGLIMGGAFGTLMMSSMVMMQQFGFALCFAILCDALMVRTYIVPAVMHLLGDWNWKGPKFMQKKAVPAAEPVDREQ